MSAFAATWTTIAQMALVRINQERIGSIDDDTQMAETIRDLRLQVAAEVLELHDWGSATGRSYLTAIAGEINGLWHHQYGLPVDFVRATAVWPYTVGTDGTTKRPAGVFEAAWKVEGDRIFVGGNVGPFSGQAVAGSSGHALSYVRYQETDVGRWSPTLRRCVALKLALDLSVGTAGADNLHRSIEAEFERSLRRGAFSDTSREGAAMQRYDNGDLGDTRIDGSQTLAGGSADELIVGGSF